MKLATRNVDISLYGLDLVDECDLWTRASNPIGEYLCRSSWKKIWMNSEMPVHHSSSSSFVQHKIAYQSAVTSYKEGSSLLGAVIECRQKKEGRRRPGRVEIPLTPLSDVVA